MTEGGSFQFECQTFLTIVHFDQIIGPNLIQIFPEIETEKGKRVSKVLQQLIDVGSLHDRREFEFVYSDRYFSSLNVYLTVLNSNARGGQSDFMISAMLMPTYSQVVSSMVMDWNSLYELKMNCIELLTQGVLSNQISETKEELRFILATNIGMIKESIQAKLNIMSPDQFNVI